MKKIDNFYEEIGTFETFVGEIIMINGNIFLPIFNAQLINHPLNMKFGKKIIHIDYCYFLFQNVAISQRDVYHNSETPFLQTNYVNEILLKNIQPTFLLEMLDYNKHYQYWNWEIRAEKFSIVYDDFNLQIEPFKEMNKSFFMRNHYEYLGDIIRNL